ncbi:hypothetical protein D6777_01455 [Candidatus Woesearchaeota archaeon]|nr:MAG: hypothetical protein D6777_01455 [Candidatus Woesearchaeota archaeon]
MNLIGILDTENNKNRIEYENNTTKDGVIVKELNLDLDKCTFKDVIEYMTSDVDEMESPVANEAKQYVNQHNGYSTLCQIKTCDEQGNYSNNKPLNLEDKVKPYVTKRNIDGEEINCIDMTVDQITAVGYKAW